MGENGKDGKVIGSLVKAVDILKSFENREELGVSELAAGLGLHKSTVFSLIRTLEHLGLLEKSENTHKYRLGVELFRLGSMVSLNIRSLARYELERLQSEVRETVHLAERSDRHVLFIERFESAYAVKLYTVDAKPLPVYATASGKAVLSTMDDALVSKLIDRITFEQFTENTICSGESLMEDIRATRERGFAVDNEEYELGLYCVAAPLYDWRGRADYAVSVSGPKVRTAGENCNFITEQVKKTAAVISEKHGYRGI